MFLPDGNDFVFESSDTDISDELVPYMHVILLKTVWKVFVYKIVPLYNMVTFLLPWRQYIHMHKNKS